MKLTSKIYALGAVLTVLSLMLLSCEKNDLRLKETIDPSNGSFFKLGWFSPALQTQGVRLKINGEVVSNQLGLGYTSTSTYAMPFPGGGLNTGGNNKNDYLSVPVGNVEIKVAVPKKGTAEDSIVVLTTTANLEQGRYYSLMVTDSFPNIQSYVLNDDVSYADSGSIKLRFTNAIPNVGGTLEFVRSNTTTGYNKVVASNVNFKEATDFLVLPYVAGSDTIKIRKTGTTTFLATYATSSMTNRRVFTVVGRGYVGATGSRAPGVSIVFNK